MITKRVQINLHPNSSLDDLEALLVEAREEFGDNPTIVGAAGDHQGVVLYAQAAQ